MLFKSSIIKNLYEHTIFFTLGKINLSIINFGFLDLIIANKSFVHYNQVTYFTYLYISKLIEGALTAVRLKLFLHCIFSCISSSHILSAPLIFFFCNQ